MEQQDFHKQISTSQENKWKSKKVFMVKEHYNLNNHRSPPILTDKLNTQSNNNKFEDNNNNQPNNKFSLVISRCQNNNVKIF